MQRDRGCLSSLSPGQQRLLTLRAGLDGGSTRSAAAVARILHLSGAREAQAEGRALADLRGQADHGCRGAVVATSLATFAGTRRASMVSWIAPAAGSGAGLATGAGSVSSPGTGSPPARVKTSASNAGSATDLNNGVTRANGQTKSKHGSSQHNGVAVAINSSSSTTSLLPILVALLALTGAGLLLWPLLQRRLRPEGGTDVGSSDELSPDANATNGATPEPAPSGTPLAGVASAPNASPAAPSAGRSAASAAMSPVGPVGAVAAGTAAAGAVVDRAPAAGAAAGRAPTTGAAEAGASAASPVARASSPPPSPAPSWGGSHNRRRAALLAVGSAAAMRGLRHALTRRRGQR